MRRIGGVLVAAAAAALLSGCSAQASSSTEAQPIAVSVTRARVPRAQPIFSGSASAVATHTYRLAFEIAGRITRVNADVGDRVAAGDVLAALADDDYRAQLAAAQARLAGARALAEKAVHGARPQEKAGAGDAVNVARAQLDDAEAALTLARANSRRSEHLYVEGAISAQTNDAASAAERSAQARVDAARAGVSSAQSQASLVDAGTRSEDRTAAVADVDDASAARDLAAIALRKTQLLSPADAYVEERDVEAGDEAAPGVAVFTLTDAAPPDALVVVPEARAVSIDVGTPASLTAGGRRYAARVTRIEPRADATTHTVEVRLHAPGLVLRPGSIAIASIGTRSLAGASVPAGALITSDEGATSVAVVDLATQTITHRPVRVLELLGGDAVVAGIRPNELVATEGAYPARDGQRVTIVPQQK